MLHRVGGIVVSDAGVEMCCTLEGVESTKQVWLAWVSVVLVGDLYSDEIEESELYLKGRVKSWCMLRLEVPRGFLTQNEVIRYPLCRVPGSAYHPSIRTVQMQYPERYLNEPANQHAFPNSW